MNPATPEPKPRRNIRWMRWILLIIASLLGGIMWWAFPGEPRIEFVETRDGKFGRETYFRIINSTRIPYAYLEWSTGHPGFSYRFAQSGELLPVERFYPPGLVGGLSPTIIQPGESRTILIATIEPARRTPYQNPDEPYAVGIPFTPCDKNGSPRTGIGPIRRITNWLRAKFGKPPLGDEITWSQTARFSDKPTRFPEHPVPIPKTIDP